MWEFLLTDNILILKNIQSGQTWQTSKKNYSFHIHSDPNKVYIKILSSNITHLININDVTNSFSKTNSESFLTDLCTFLI